MTIIERIGAPWQRPLAAVTSWGLQGIADALVPAAVMLTICSLVALLHAMLTLAAALGALTVTTVWGVIGVEVEMNRRGWLR